MTTIKLFSADGSAGAQHTYWLREAAKAQNPEFSFSTELNLITDGTQQDRDYLQRLIKEGKIAAANQHASAGGLAMVPHASPEDGNRYPTPLVPQLELKKDADPALALTQLYDVLQAERDSLKAQGHTHGEGEVIDYIAGLRMTKPDSEAPGNEKAHLEITPEQLKAIAHHMNGKETLEAAEKIAEIRKFCDFEHAVSLQEDMGTVGNPQRNTPSL